MKRDVGGLCLRLRDAGSGDRAADQINRPRKAGRCHGRRSHRAPRGGHERCDDGPPPLPEWVEEVATRPIPDVVYPVPQGPMLMGPVDTVPFPELPEFMVRATFPRLLVIP